MVRKRNSAPKPVARQATPTKMASSTRSDGLIIQVGVDEMATKDALRTAKRIIRDELPGKWNVTAMGSHSRDFVVRRPVGEKNPTVSQAFDFANQLRQHRDVEDCEPSLFWPNTAPKQIQAEQAIMRQSFGSSSSGGGDGQSLACSINHDWVIQHCKIAEAWALAVPQGGRAFGESIVIGHPDTGYTDHPELDAIRVLKSRGRDFESGDTDPRDILSGRSGGHGTSTSSVIMSTEGTGAVVSGVAPRAKLVPLRVTTDVVLLSFGKLAEAIRYAADEGMHVLSISLGGPFGSRYLHRAVQYAIDRGVIIVSAAGNVWPFVVYPAKLDEVVAVAASNCQRQVWASSASGPAVDITAPGESVWRALAQSTGFSVQRSSGTSYATAITAGAAALWLAYHGRDQLIQRFGIGGIAAVFKELIVSQGFDRPPNWDTANFGPGILNVLKLLRAQLPGSSPAGGIRAVRAATSLRANSQTDELTELFPTESPGQIRRSLGSMLNATESRLPYVISDVAEEIAYHAVTDMRFRQAFKNSLPADATAFASGNSASKTTNPTPKTRSNQLRQLMK